MGEPNYRLEGIVHTRSDAMEDFEGPLDVIFLLLSKNKIEIQDVSIAEILEQYCRAEGLPCAVVPDQMVDGVRVSSTYIREQLEDGDMATAVKFLGHPIS